MQKKNSSVLPALVVPEALRRPDCMHPVRFVVEDWDVSTTVCLCVSNSFENILSSRSRDHRPEHGVVVARLTPPVPGLDGGRAGGPPEAVPGPSRN